MPVVHVQLIQHKHQLLFGARHLQEPSLHLLPFLFQGGDIHLLVQLVLDEIPELFHRHHITDDLNHFPIQFVLIQGRFKIAEMFFVNLLPMLASVIEIVLVLPGLLIFPPSHRPGHPGTADRAFQDPG